MVDLHTLRPSELRHAGAAQWARNMVYASPYSSHKWMIGPEPPE